MALWRVEQAAEYLGIRPKTLYEWVRLGRVPYRKIGFNVRFDPGDLERWVAEQARGASAASGPTRRQPTTGPQAKPKGKRRGESSSPPPEVATLRRLATAASEALRELDRDLGASLSYPQRRRLTELAARLDEAAGPRASDPPADS